MTEAAEFAEAYLDLGIAPVPVMPRGKVPGWGGRPQQGWQNLRLALEDLPGYFAQDANVGIILGFPSRGLVDIDLDCPEAIELGPRFLLATWTFGRAGAPRSHWLYMCRGVATHQFRDDTKAMVVELRSTGAQTVAPGSTHPSGESIEWTDDLDGAELPLEVSPASLLLRVERLAEASLVARHAGRKSVEEYLAGRTVKLPEAIRRLFREWRGERPIPRPGRRSGVREELPEHVSEGGRNVALTKLAGRLRRAGLGEESIGAALLSENASRCSPPLSERDVLRIARSVSRYPAGGVA